ncbi:MAG: ATP-binding protein [Actinobacteria bacterium]|nr:ATP-binding protein [Cyanobacteriota bacterium]MCL5771653.1 ATP-binding protein [Actinomycetota bacterium]
MYKFIDRKLELEFLNKIWVKKESQFIIIYGKRRIGKTELIKEFLKNKNSIYYLCDRATEKENLRNLGRIVGNKFGSSIVIENGFNDWYQFFNFLKDTVKERIVIAIDEFPYLFSSNKAISSVFQKGWDEILKYLPVFLILCGSSISMMLKETIAHNAPLYGRRTGQIFLKPLNFYDAWGFFPELSFDNFLNIYSICGGIPLYLKQFNPKISFRDNLKENIFNKNSVLYDEGNIILSEQLSELRIYFAILKALSLGKTKFGEILNYTGLSKTSIHKYLYVLEEFQLIRKGVPITEEKPEKSRKGLYKIIDPFLNFWFKYLLPFKSEIEFGDLDEIFKFFDKQFNFTTSLIYQDVCKEIIQVKLKDVLKFQKIGSWWDTIGKESIEIDIVAINNDNNNILFGEAKWSNKKVGINILYELKKKSSFVKREEEKRKEYYILFSRSGFTKDLIKIAKNEKNIFLINKDEPYIF